MFPASWSTERLAVRSVGAADVEELLEVFNASSDAGVLDPTFRGASREEIEDLVARSLQPAMRFTLQSASLAGSGRMIGYFHFTEDLPEPGLVWLSIFVLRPEFRAQGYGRELATGLLARLRDEAAARAARGRVFLQNLPALRFWTAQGLTKIVPHKGEYVQTVDGRPCIVLERELQG